MRPLAASTIHPPFAAYSHGIEVPPGTKLVFCSGQLGVGPDGTVPRDCGGQAELCFGNISAILADAGLGLADIVRINAFVTAREHMRPYMDVRDRLFPPPYPASTLMIVAGFTRPEFLIEVEAVAAGPAWYGPA